MRTSGSLQKLMCLMVYVTQVHSIMVKFGTKEGPILPPAPTVPTPSNRRIDILPPAPVWESRNDDTPNPNANWKPPLFVPYQPRYTEVVITPSGLSRRDPVPLQKTFSFAQRIASLYKPKTTTNQFLSSQNVPGLGITYFMPAYLETLKKDKQVRDPREEEQNENHLDEQDSSPSESQINDIRHQKILRDIYTLPIGPFKFVPPPYVESKEFRRPNYY